VIIEKRKELVQIAKQYQANRQPHEALRVLHVLNDNHFASYDGRHILKQIRNCYHSLEMHEQAISYGLQLCDVHEQRHEYEGCAGAYYGLSWIYFDVGFCDEALQSGNMASQYMMKHISRLDHRIPRRVKECLAAKLVRYETTTLMYAWEIGNAIQHSTIDTFLPFLRENHPDKIAANNLIRDIERPPQHISSFRQLPEWREAKLETKRRYCHQPICCDNSKLAPLHVHHLNCAVSYPAQRFDQNNLVLLCEPCHRAFHGLYGIFCTVDDFNRWIGTTATIINGIRTYALR